MFDTGLHRHLTLSHHDGDTSRMQWGRPQPETVRDHAIQILEDGSWNELFAVSGNYHRLRSHAVEPVRSIRALRISVSATNGVDHARIMEVRAGANDVSCADHG